MAIAADDNQSGVCNHRQMLQADVGDNSRRDTVQPLTAFDRPDLGPQQP